MKGFFEQQRSSSIDQKLSRHLPNNLYQALQDKGLLDGTAHDFTIIEPESNTSIPGTAEIYSMNAKGDVPETVTLKINIENTQVLTSFTNKMWYTTATILPSGQDFITGNDKSVPLLGLTEDECRIATPKITQETVDFINSINTQEPALAQKTK